MASSVGGTTTDSSAAAWEQGTLSAAESYADAQADAESAARSKADADAAAAAAAANANANAGDGVTSGQSPTTEPAQGDGFGPTAAQRAQSAFWGHDSPPGTGANAPAQTYISNEEAQQLRAAGFVVETDDQGRNTVPAQAGNDVILQGSGGGLPAPGGTPTTANVVDPTGPAPQPIDAGPSTAPTVSGPDDAGGSREPAKIVSKLGPEVDDLINRSPTLRRKWEAAVKAEWKIEIVRNNERSYAQPGKKGGGKVVINLNDVKPGGDTVGKLTSLLSHELGHAVSDNKAVIPANNKADFVSKNADRAVDAEGDAAFENARTRDEILENGGRDIEIRGGLDQRYIAIYADFKAGLISEAQARAEMSEVQGSEQGTLDPKGPTRRQLFEAQYEEAWDKAHKPQ
jgi:hypothetical protein